MIFLMLVGFLSIPVLWGCVWAIRKLVRIVGLGWTIGIGLVVGVLCFGLLPFIVIGLVVVLCIPEGTGETS